MSRFRTMSVPAKVKFISKSLLSADFALLYCQNWRKIFQKIFPDAIAKIGCIPQKIYFIVIFRAIIQLFTHAFWHLLGV